MTNISKAKSKYCSYYWLFEPVGGDVIDGPGRKPVFEVPALYKGQYYNFSLFCKDNGSPEYARLIIHGLETEEIPEEMLPFLQTLKEHLLSILRLFYDEETRLFRYVWFFQDEDKPPQMHINLTEKLGERILDAETIRSLFISTFDCREEVRLFADGANERIPLQYRYLSFYKIIENIYRVKGCWQINELDNLLSKHRSLFINAGFTSKPSALMHEVRDRCAHIKTGTKKEVIGVTHLNHREAVRVERLLPILKELCVDLINQKAKGNFLLSNVPLSLDQAQEKLAQHI